MRDMRRKCDSIVQRFTDVIVKGELCYWRIGRYCSGMIIKLPRLPLKFSSPDGEMEITVRPVPAEKGGRGEHYCGAACFITHGPRALERIRLTANFGSHAEVRHALLTGFKVRAYDQGTQDYKVTQALVSATGVEEVEVA